MASPGFPSPSNAWLGWPSTSKPNAWHGNTQAVNLYINAHLNWLSGQPTPRSGSAAWHFGWTTYNAVKNYQAFWGLTVDGWCGPQTYAVMDWHTTL